MGRQNVLPPLRGWGNLSEILYSLKSLQPESCLYSTSLWARKGVIIASMKLAECSFSMPEGPIKCPSDCKIHDVFCHYTRNSASLMCVPRTGKNIGTRGSYMSFEAYESRILMHSVPLPRFGTLGAEGFEMSYLIDFLLFR